MNADIAALKSQGFYDGRWSCGGTKRIAVNDRLYLLRQGVEPRGIIASGFALSAPYEDAHWDGTQNHMALYLNVRFDALLNPEQDGVLPLARLKDGHLGSVNWRTQTSGISINALAASELDRLWHDFLSEHGQSPAILPEEIPSPSLFYEGSIRTISVNAYERDPRARRACIDHYGTKCAICGFDFGTTYGSLGKGFIHVHHVIHLSKVGAKYAIDPVRDLRPVCPNCHAMLHIKRDGLSIEELQNLLSTRNSLRGKVG